MNWTEYTERFDPIINKEFREAPYDNVTYVEYVQLNKSRINRWLKKAQLSEATIATIEAISEPQHWILITEPWCGDAAHNAPIIQMMAALNPKITLEIVLRDSSDLIDSYLTNGGKSIPKLIVRDQNEKDLFTWGPRPMDCQKLVSDMKATDLSPQAKNTQIQLWYNSNKGQQLQEELVALLKG